MIELTQIDAEGHDLEYLIAIRERVTRVFQAIPEIDRHAWVLQIYVQDEPISGLTKEVLDYVQGQPRGSAFRDHFLKVFSDHLDVLSRRGGLFVDKDTQARWGAKSRRVRAMLYRTFATGVKGSKSPEQTLNQVCRSVMSGFSAAGIVARRCTGVDMVEWLLPWLSPSPPAARDGYEYLRKYPYDRARDDPDNEDRLASNDLAEAVLLTTPRSDAEEGVWYFGNEAHRVLTVERLRTAPRLGSTSLEERGDTRKAVLLDALPEGTIIAMTVVIKPQDDVREGIELTASAAVGESQVSAVAGIEAGRALEEMARDRRAYPLWLSVFIRSTDDAALDDDTDTAVTVLAAAGLEVIDTSADLIALGSYPLNLPMGYKPANEKRTLRTRLQWDQHLANLLPVYGASTGTDHCGMFFLNVNGGPIMIDPLNPTDRQMSAHGLILGPTGSGKSAMLVYLSCWLMAVHKPHLYIIDVGDSFGLLGQYLKSQGFSVNHIRLDPNSDVSLPPFADAPKIFEQSFDDRDDGEDEERRDILMELEIAARYLITQGKEEEEKRLHAEDSWTIRNAIILAAAKTIEDNRTQTMVDDVVWALRAISRGARFFHTEETLDPARRPRASEMADAMAVFCTGEAARYFNRPGQGLPECDVTIVDFESLVGDAKRELFVVFMGLMNQINADISRRRLGGRPTVVINDEAHITTTNPLMAQYVVRGSKMWRKKGAWLWMATQDLIDFPDEAAAILNQAEWWFCLSMTAKHVEGIARFKTLSADERALLLSARKKAGAFVDGVILSRLPSMLFRNVPPALCLALAQTEQHEAAARVALAKAEGITELEAVERIAEQINDARWGATA